MSGTSADGVDVALCDIHGAPHNLRAQLIQAHTAPYSPRMRQGILDCCAPESSHSEAVAQLHVDLAQVFADCLLDLLARAGMSPQDVDLVGMHGHTIWHHVRADGSVSASLQIGEAAVIAERTQITTISNFRARDIAAGGQGAPLTSYVDWLLLRHDSHWRAIQNIGGMGNVTFLPPLSDNASMPVAFDTGPGNALLDAAMSDISGGTTHYDRDGELARQGRVNEEWLESLLQHPFYARGYPKSTGRETFGSPAASQLLADARARGLHPSEILATLTALTANSIASAYRRFAPAPIAEVILGGGGRHNPIMRGMLQELLAPAELLAHEDIGYNSDFKEALVFAVLAHETWHARPATLPALTGARHPSILGQITPGANYLRLLSKRWA